MKKDDQVENKIDKLILKFYLAINKRHDPDQQD